LSDLKLTHEGRTSLSQFTVGVLLEHPAGAAQDHEMTAVLEAAIDQLTRAGLRIDARPVGVDHVRAHQNYLLLNYAATALTERSDRPAIEGRNDAVLSHRRWLQVANERQRIRDQWLRYFDDVDLLLCPVTAGVAPFHQTNVPFVDQTIPVSGKMVSNQDQWLWVGVASGAYLPATVVPVGQTAEGLPVGLQIVGPFAGDLRSIKLAELVEQELGGYSPPPLVAST